MSGWDSEDDLLNEEAGFGSATAAFKDDDLDEDALLGEGGLSGCPVLEGNVGGSSEGEESLGDTQDDANAEEHVQQNEQYEEQHVEAQDECTEEQEELDYEDDMIELEVTEEDELVELGIAPEEEEDFAEFNDSNLNSSQLQETPVSSTVVSEQVSEPVSTVVTREQEVTKVEEAPEEDEESDKEEDSKKEEEEEDDNEEEEESERGRFKSERKDTEISTIRTVSSAASRKVIPDKLELSTEQEEEISKFEQNNTNRRYQQGRGGRGGHQRGGFQRGGLMGQGPGPRPHWSRGSFPQQMNQPVPRPKTILINPHFQGSVQVQQNVLLRDTQMQIPGAGVRFGMNQPNPPPLLAPNVQLQQQQQQQQQHFQRSAVSWSGPTQPLMQQPLHNQQSFQQQQRFPNMLGQARPQMNMPLHQQGQHLQQQQPPRLMQPGLMQNRFQGSPQHGNQIGNQGNRIVFGQPGIQPRIHWEGNHGNQNIAPNNQGPSMPFGTPGHGGGHMQHRPSIRFGQPVRQQARHQESAGQPIQTVVGSHIQTVVGGQRRQQPPLMQPTTVTNQQPRFQHHVNRPQQLSPNKNQMPQQPPQRRSVKDRLGPRPAPVATQQQPGGADQLSGVKVSVKRKSTEPTSPSPAKAVKAQSAGLDESDYERKLEEQRKVREKIKAMKEKKRLEAAESRRQDLIKRLAEEGKTLDEIINEPAAKKQHLQQQEGSSLPTRQGVYINQHGKQVVRMSRAQHDNLIQQGLVQQGQMPKRFLRAPGAQPQRPPFPHPGQPPDRFPGQGPSQHDMQEQVQMSPHINPPQLGRGGGMQNTRGRGGSVGPSGPGRGLLMGPRAQMSTGPGRGRAALLQQAGGAPISVGRGVQRTLRQVNTSVNIQPPLVHTSPPKAVNRQVLRPGSSPKAAKNGAGMTVNAAGRGKVLENAVRGPSLASRLGPPPDGGGRGRGRGLIIPGVGSEPKGRGAALQTTKPVGRMTRNMVNLGRGQRLALATKIKQAMTACCYGDYRRHFEASPDILRVGGSGDGNPGPGGPVTVQITGIPAGGIQEVQKCVRATSAAFKDLTMDQIHNAASVTFPSMAVAKKFKQQNDRRMINMGLIHVNIVQ